VRRSCGTPDEWLHAQGGQSRPSMTPPGMSLSAILPASASLVSVVARTVRRVNDPSFVRILNRNTWAARSAGSRTMLLAFAPRQFENAGSPSEQGPTIGAVDVTTFDSESGGRDALTTEPAARTAVTVSFEGGLWLLCANTGMQQASASDEKEINTFMVVSPQA
jgi:hypothetical protein